MTPSGPPPPKKILICDDDETFSELLEMLLVKEGYTVSKVDNGFACLERLTDERPDLLLLDLNIPNINGFQIMESISRSEALRGIPVMVVTAHERQEDKGILEKFGVKSITVKPINCEQLVSDISKVLSEVPAPDAAH